MQNAQKSHVHQFAQLLWFLCNGQKLTSSRNVLIFAYRLKNTLQFKVNFRPFHKKSQLLRKWMDMSFWKLLKFSWIKRKLGSVSLPRNPNPNAWPTNIHQSKYHWAFVALCARVMPSESTFGIVFWVVIRVRIIHLMCLRALRKGVISFTEFS